MRIPENLAMSVFALLTMQSKPFTIVYDETGLNVNTDVHIAARIALWKRIGYADGQSDHHIYTSDAWWVRAAEGDFAPRYDYVEVTHGASGRMWEISTDDLAELLGVEHTGEWEVNEVSLMVADAIDAGTLTLEAMQSVA
jgi:hypothetical protein